LVIEFIEAAAEVGVWGGELGQDVACIWLFSSTQRTIGLVRTNQEQKLTNEITILYCDRKLNSAIGCEGGKAVTLSRF
jgi:hypothetical protein